MKNFLLYTVITGLFLIPITPFIVASTMYFPFIVGKAFFFRFLIEIIFGAYILLAILEPQYRPKISLITKSLGLFALVMLVANLLGENPFKSFWSNYERMEGYVLILHLLMYFIVATGVFQKISDWKKWFNTSLLASFVVSIYSIAQINGAVAINQGGVRVDATFGNATYLAIYLVFHIFLALYMLSRSNKNSWQVWVYGSLAFLHTIILYYTATRGAILGLIGGLFVTGILLAIKERQNPTIRRVSLSILGGVVALVLIFIAIRNTSFVQTSPVLSRFATLSLEEIKTQGRYFVWPMAIEGFKDKPLLGWGQENFNYVFNKNYDPRMYAQEQWFDRTHNIFLDWLIAGGIVGLLAYAGIYFALLYLLWKKENGLSNTEKAIFTGMISAYIFHNMFVFDNLVSYIMFFAVLGFIHSVSVEGKNAISTKTVSSVTYNYAIVPAVLILTIALVYFVNVPGFKTNKALISAMTPRGPENTEQNIEEFKRAFAYDSFGRDEVLEQVIQFSSQLAASTQVSNEVKQKATDLTLEEIENKLKRNPKDARYFVFAGGFANRINRQDLAINYLERAKELSPRKQTIMFEIGAAHLAKGDTVKAMEIFKEAYDLEPASPESQIIYALGGIYSGNPEIVSDMFAKLGEERVLFDNRIVTSYVNIGDVESAINILNERIKREPSNLQHKLNLASIFADLGQNNMAIDLIREVIDLDPNFKDQGEQYIKEIQGL